MSHIKFIIGCCFTLLLYACTTTPISPPTKSPKHINPAAFKASLNNAAHSLEQGDVTLAIHQLPRYDPKQPNALKIHYHQLAGQILQQQHKLLASVKEYLKLETLLTDEKQILANQRHIITQLSTLSKEELLQVPFSMDALGGWVELALIKHASLSPQRFSQRINDWKRIHFNHPAKPQILTELRKSSLQAKAHHIAILLPLTGPLATYSQALSTGIIASYYQDAMDDRPTIRHYNTHQQDILKVYQQAITDGANLVIGPLQKSAIQILAAQPNLAIPILALNVIDTPNPQLYYFGLAPEDEARAVAERMANDGIRQVAALAPDSDWGRRIATAFQQAWQSDGQKLTTSLYYPQSLNNYAPIMETLSNDKASTARRLRLQKLLQQPLKFSSRARQDIDAIFLVANPQQARQWIPQFRYYRLNQTKVYSTSHIYTGIPAASLDADINGAYFPDIPWLAPHSDAHQLLPAGHPYHHNRLFALGLDSYKVLNKLSPDLEWDGYTGHLSLNQQTITRTNLDWYQFQQGEPQAVHYEPIR